jgi:hypothetical protein
MPFQYSPLPPKHVIQGSLRSIEFPGSLELRLL